jgi:hypothetical protein
MGEKSHDRTHCNDYGCHRRTNRGLTFRFLDHLEQECLQRKKIGYLGRAPSGRAQGLNFLRVRYGAYQHLAVAREIA